MTKNNIEVICYFISLFACTKNIILIITACELIRCLDAAEDQGAWFLVDPEIDQSDKLQHALNVAEVNEINSLHLWRMNQWR